MKVKGRNIIDFGVLAIVILLVFCFFSFYYVPKKLLRPTYKVIMNDAGGLIVGSAVTLSGKQIGHVTNIKLKGDIVELVFVIDDKTVKKLPKKCVLALKSSGIAGSKSIDLYQDKNSSTDEIVVRDTLRQADVNNVQLEVLRDTINAGNAITVLLPPNKLFEVKRFMQSKLVTTGYEKFFDNIIKTEDKYNNTLQEDNKLKKFNKKLEKFNERNNKQK